MLRSAAGWAAVFLFVFWFGHVSLVAQEDVIARARAAASDGRRPEGIALLEAHLAQSPRDVDARLVYGLILSWEGRYDEARKALQDVLTQTPDYMDARVALMNVEWWSGNRDAAREHVQAVLRRDPGNTQARHVKERLDARTLPWSAGYDFTYDTFSDDRTPWKEHSIWIRRGTPIGTAIVRSNHANRFDRSDQQVQFEFYPSIRPGTYAFVEFGLGTDDELYPGNRESFDLYQSIGRGFELSGGFRRLDFGDVTTMYVGSLSKYIGHWMLTGRVFYVPDERLGGSWSFHSQVRWYFGSEGTNWLGGGYGHGLSREEPRGTGDLVNLDANTLRGQGEIDLGRRMHWTFSASTSRQERASLLPLRQTTTSTGLSFRF